MEEVKISLDVKPLNEDEIFLLEAFVKSQAYPLLKRVVAIQRAAELSDIMRADDKDSILRIQGRIQGLNAIEFLPLTMQHAAEQLKAKKAAEEKKKKRQ